jgi:formylglycine-generating enzyme required for sulfatase activity
MFFRKPLSRFSLCVSLTILETHPPGKAGMFIMNNRWFPFSVAVVFLCVCGQGAPNPFPQGVAKAGEAGNPKEITNSIGMKLVLIPKGTFFMGSPPDEIGSQDYERLHEVTISRDYYMGVHEVTQAQYKKVMGKNPSYFQGDKVAIRHLRTNRVVKDVDSSNHPVEQVSWGEAVEFCERLSALPEEKKAGRVYRLPTEAQWEYACRAGSTTAYGCGKDRSLFDHAWYEINSQDQTHAVGQKKPNAWGMHDMHGNVWEWCSDWYDAQYYTQSPKDNPEGPKRGSGRVARGGCWRDPAVLCRSAFRDGGIPGYRDVNLGFRVSAGPS